MTTPQISNNDFIQWCKTEKGIPNILVAPFDTWLSCIHEYCDIYYKDYYAETINILVKLDKKLDKKGRKN